jgi:hypothetical protein
MKIIVLWVVAPIREQYQGDCPDDGGSKHLRNVGKFYQTARRNNPENSHLKSSGVIAGKEFLEKMSD